jgi:hypothetical protein
MNHKFIITTAIFALTLTAASVKAETTKTTNTENGVQTTHIHQSDDPAVGDPGGNNTANSREDRGPANTQKYCEDGSTDPDCARAAKRQTSPTTWQQDCAAGSTHACGSSSK